MSFARLSSFLVAAVLATGLAACGGPSVDDLAADFCTCNEIADGTATPADRAACITAATDDLAKASDACLTCLDEKLGDKPTAASCAAADSCTACMFGD
ncbi:MAG: hypothetical protein K8W52_04895 [Deltaproteobacteria bacterium]|nr:hypothetical protein [Deltaproteobacteria bacterium]